MHPRKSGLGVSVNDVKKASVFGRRKEPHTVIIACGDTVRHFTFRPWVAALAGSVLAAFAIGYLLATSYLVLRDDLLGASAARQARLQHAYEDRISALRSQVDRITSRQLLDQQLVETKVAELLERQTQLSERHGQLSPLLERIEGAGDRLPDAAPVPELRPDTPTDLRARLAPVKGVAAEAPVAAVASTGLTAFRGDRILSGHGESAADRADRVFRVLNQSLRSIESEQIERLDRLTENAFQTADQIAEALEGAGLPLDDGDETDGATGGPLLPVDAFDFESRVRELDAALAKLDGLKTMAREMPIHNPAPGQPLSSRFGVRRDPFLRTPAMHAGIDFRARTGTPVRASGAGAVTAAGWNGGYGRMVEIDHGHGFTTRYAHLSRISVSVGDRIETGAEIGAVGSTGRSTGPHLHYEVRRDGKALNPIDFLKAGKTLGELL